LFSFPSINIKIIRTAHLKTIYMYIFICIFHVVFADDDIDVLANSSLRTIVRKYSSLSLILPVSNV